MAFAQDAVDKYFDKFEVHQMTCLSSLSSLFPSSSQSKVYCLRNVFRIPQHVCLDGDLPPPPEQPSEADDVAASAELHDLTAQIKEVSHWRALELWHPLMRTCAIRRTRSMLR